MQANKICRFSIALFLTFFFFTPAVLMATGASEAVAPVTDMASKAGIVEKLNINTASIESLASIPGIGPKIGESIVAYREAQGAFSSISDLVNVEGIDASLLEKIKPFLSI